MLQFQVRPFSIRGVTTSADSTKKSASAINSNTTLGYVVLTLRVAQADDQWTAICEELGTATYADTMDEALSELRELVSLHLNGLEDFGERERFFAEHGLEIIPSPDVQVQSSISVTIGGGAFPEFIPITIDKSNIARHLEYAH